ncbi:Ig-like domain-containing protein [Botrimarina hoheduenensis]|uniref:Uncharacterized protein n=1 Tax=Botrimarina hoheduenensis TaxID=2528000 RepID=A0A5C5VVJ1_9BACT|nr:Ig-like domain-containing protein [Botrimarina hoheduenensis]TWT41621.1 hypothetical protein Pla111_29980 [Botrimarina hoheduenensis]
MFRFVRRGKALLTGSRKTSSIDRVLDWKRGRRLRAEPLEDRRLLAVLIGGGAGGGGNDIEALNDLEPPLGQSIGSEPTVSIANFRVDSAVGDQTDVFRYRAHQTGKIVLEAFATNNAIDIDVVDDLGASLIGGPRAASEVITLPAIEGELYYFTVTDSDGALGSGTVYALEIENLHAPVPSGLALTPDSDTGASNSDGITSDNTPSFVIQNDLETFLEIPRADVQIGTIDSEGGIGYDTDLLITNRTSGAVTVIDADRLGLSAAWTATAPALPDGEYIVSARTRVILGQPLLSAENAVFVIDISGSTGNTFAGDSIGDQNGDGTPNTILDAEIAGFKALNQQLIDRGSGNTAMVSIVAFESVANLIDMDPDTPGIQFFTTPLADTDGDGTTNVEEALMLLRDTGGTDFESAFQGVLSSLSQAGFPNGSTDVVFLSDGDGGSGFADEVATIRDTLGQNIRAFGVGAGSSLDLLLAMDPAAIRFSNTNELIAAFNGGGGVGGGAVGYSLLSEPIFITIASEGELGAPAAPDLLASSDTGMRDTDNVTSIRQIAVSGFGPQNLEVDVFARRVVNGVAGPALLVGEGTIGTDGSDGVAGDGQGLWEITLEPLADGTYDLFAIYENAAGVRSAEGDALRVWIDTDAPNTPFLDLTTDAGRSSADDVTLVSRPTVVMRSNATTAGGATNGFPNDVKFRLYVRPDGNVGASETLVYDSFADTGDFVTFADITRQISLTLNNTNGTAIPDGVHNFKLEIEDRAGNISPDFLLPFEIDTVAPPVAFGDPTDATDGLDAASDTGVAADPTTLSDRITSDSTPTFFGQAEANAIVRLFADLDGDGAVTAGDLLLGQTVAIPLSGNNAFATGRWEITSAIDLNAASVFPLDGLRQLLVTAEDVAGNVNTASDGEGDTEQRLGIFLDTQGPQVGGVYVTGERDYDLFDPKPSTDGPTPLVNSLDIDFVDFPMRGMGGAVGAGAIDVFLLFDDTGSFSGVAPTLTSQFPSIIAALQAAIPGMDLGFGVGRFEDFGNGSGNSTGNNLPFILNQPIVLDSTVGFTDAINSALTRVAPGGGDDSPESGIEALFQIATGLGYDGNSNGSVLDNGVAGSQGPGNNPQTNPGSSGDVPNFGSYTPAGMQLPAAGNRGGGGFRDGATPIILVATDVGTRYFDTNSADSGEVFVGVDGVMVSEASFLPGRDTEFSGPVAAGRGIQETIDALIGLGAIVIGLGDNANFNGSGPRDYLEAVSRLTGSTNQSGASIASGIAGDPIDPGDPFYFQIDPNSGENIASAIVAAVTGAVGGGFVYPAVADTIATNPGRYRLVGDRVGLVAIESIEFIDNTMSGGPGETTIRLNFFDPLPDDRYTLTIVDSLTDDPGNRLDGESNAAEPQETPLFPSGDKVPGGDFVSRFTVDSRPEIGTFVAANISIDANGDFVWNPSTSVIGGDATNADLSFTLPVRTPAGAIGPGGYNVNDLAFAGKFSLDTAGQSDGFDTLAAFGYSAELGIYRWLIDRDHDGVVSLGSGDIIAAQSRYVQWFDTAGAIPVAGNFDGNLANGDEIGLYNRGSWLLDTNRDFVLSGGDALFYNGLMGHPIVGDFDGDGLDDAAVFNSNQLFFNFANDGLTDAAEELIIWGYPGVLDRPVAADFDQDGIDDIGLWVPRNSSATPRTTSEWYLKLSGNPDSAARPANYGSATYLNHPFTPAPFGNDRYAEFGDELALPIVGNFDPPVAGGASSAGTTSGALSAATRSVTPMPASIASAIVMAGDIDANGKVDIADELAWRAAYGSSDRAADLNEDGEVDVADYTVYRDHAGAVAAGFSVLQATAIKSSSIATGSIGISASPVVVAPLAAREATTAETPASTAAESLAEPGASEAPPTPVGYRLATAASSRAQRLVRLRSTARTGDDALGQALLLLASDPNASDSELKESGLKSDGRTPTGSKASTDPLDEALATLAGPRWRGV